jgi:hypothetical protein
MIFIGRRPQARIATLLTIFPDISEFTPECPKFRFVVANCAGQNTDCTPLARVWADVVGGDGGWVRGFRENGCVRDFSRFRVVGIFAMMPRCVGLPLAISRLSRMPFLPHLPSIFTSSMCVLGLHEVTVTSHSASDREDAAWPHIHVCLGRWRIFDKFDANSLIASQRVSAVPRRRHFGLQSARV